MDVEVVQGEIENEYIMIVAPSGQDSMSFNFTGSKAEFYQLYLRLREIFSN